MARPTPTASSSSAPRRRAPERSVAVPRVLQPLVDDPARAALFVDFDGSLSPIVLDPASARPLPAARAALARLVPVLARVAVVSGRPAAFLRDALAIDGLDYAGTYGLERIVAGDVVLDERVRPYLDAIVQAADEAEAALPGLHVERKGQVAVTIHWRDQPERGDDATRWAAEAAARLGLDAPLRGRMAVELRPPVPVDKGTTVAELSLGLARGRVRGRRRRRPPRLRRPPRRWSPTAGSRTRCASASHRTRAHPRCAPPTSWSTDRRVGRVARRDRRRDYRAWLSNSSSQVARRVGRRQLAQGLRARGALVARHRRARGAARPRPVRGRTGAPRPPRSCSSS